MLGKMEQKIVVLCSRPRQNVKLCIFTLQSRNDGEEMCEKARCMCKVVFLLIKTYWFIALLVAVAVVVA